MHNPTQTTLRHLGNLRVSLTKRRDAVCVLPRFVGQYDMMAMITSIIQDVDAEITAVVAEEAEAAHIISMSGPEMMPTTIPESQTHE